jgi:hypothetical protein
MGHGDEFHQVRIKGLYFMSLEGSISDHQTKKIKQFMTTGKDMKQQIADLNEALKDLAKTVAEEVGAGCEAKHLMKAVNLAFKGKIDEEQEAATIVDEILTISGETI